MKKTLIKALVLVFGLSIGTTCLAEYGLNLRKGVTEFSEIAYGLHMYVFWICVVIGVLVFGAMLWSIIFHRHSKGAKPEQFSHSTLAEAIWTIIPIVILVAISIPATTALIRMENPTDEDGKPMKMDMTIKITAFQWKWKYDYRDEGFGFYSTLAKDSNAARQKGSGVNVNTVDNYLLEVDNRMVIPVDTNIYFMITADDVNHAWWVPDFGWKRDAIPGFINEGWTNVKEPGIYRGQCAELCGKDHGFMPVVVEAVSKEDYAIWVKAQKGEQEVQVAMESKDWSKSELMAKGEEIYNRDCAACHQPNGLGMPPAFPALANSEIVNGPIAAQLDQVVNGKAGTAMAPFGDRLSDSEIAAAITYTRNSFGNQADDLIQPSDVKNFKNTQL